MLMDRHKDLPVEQQLQYQSQTALTDPQKEERTVRGKFTSWGKTMAVVPDRM